MLLWGWRGHRGSKPRNIARCSAEHMTAEDRNEPLIKAREPPFISTELRAVASGSLEEANARARQGKLCGSVFLIQIWARVFR